MNDNMMGEDTLCTYQPQGGAVITPMSPATGAMDWTEDAQTHLQRIPGFVRRMVRRRAEDYVRSEGRSSVTKDDLTLLAKRRFGDAGPPAFFKTMRGRNDT
ncbi:MAG: PCP reductase family protein [Alphaproteobacteria bacterium]